MHYTTQSKKRVVSLFCGNPFSSFTLNGIITTLDDIPKSSVYRIVDALESDGTIRKVGFDSGRRALYQLSEGNECPHHMHIRCTSCGKTVHIDGKTSSEIEEIIESRLGFSSCLSTVFTGKCPECAMKESK